MSQPIHTETRRVYSWASGAMITNECPDFVAEYLKLVAQFGAPNYLVVREETVDRHGRVTSAPTTEGVLR